MSLNRKLPILPKATAVWLVENTALTFKQIADFCGMHELEVKGIADGEVAQGIIGVDPVVNGQLTSEDIQRCTNDTNAHLQLLSSVADQVNNNKKKSTAKYIPIARRQDKPDATYWLIKNYPDMSDMQIVKLIRSSKSMIQAIRERSYWNMSNIKPRDPVLLGLCTQTELDKVVANTIHPRE